MASPTPPNLGAIALRDCSNPDCEAEKGERHDPECTPDPVRRQHPITAWSGEGDWD